VEEFSVVAVASMKDGRSPPLVRLHRPLAVRASLMPTRPIFSGEGPGLQLAALPRPSARGPPPMTIISGLKFKDIHRGARRERRG